MTASGSVGDYQETSGLQSSVARVAGVEPSAVTISVVAASVIITVTITVPASTTTSAVMTALSGSLGTAAVASAQLGITVETIPTVAIATGPSRTQPPPPHIPPPSQPPLYVAAVSSLTASRARGDDMPIDRAIDGDMYTYTPMTLSGTVGTQSINLTLAFGDQLLAGVRIYLAKVDCDQSYTPFPIYTRFEVGGTPIVGISNDAELTITEPLDASAWHVGLPCPPTLGASADGSRIDFIWPAVSASSLVVKYAGGGARQFTHFPVFEVQPLILSDLNQPPAAPPS